MLNVVRFDLQKRSAPHVCILAKCAVEREMVICLPLAEGLMAGREAVRTMMLESV